MNFINKIKGIINNEQKEKQIFENPVIAEEQFPVDFTEKEKAAIRKVAGYTMTGHERMVALHRAVEYLETNKIEGDIVECGVWRGGSTMLVANCLKECGNEERNLFLFDTYEGMVEPSDLDVSFDKQKADGLLQQVDKNEDGGNNIWCYASIEDVQANLKTTGYNSAKLHFIKGKVEDTIPTDKIQKIALLRLDTDWYESTKHELEHLYDKLVTGGVLIIDDYGHWQGAKKAVDEFIRKRNLKLFLNRIDYTGRLAIKID